MPFRVHACVLAALAGLLLALPVSGAAQASQTVPSIEFDSTVDPASEKWIGAALDDAADDGAPLAIIRLDTPGGLDSSMREIVKDIIAAPMPVVVYVSPDGARAASAGAFITQAADVAAMAPQTNIGSASADRRSAAADIERHARAQDRERRRRVRSARSPRATGATGARRADGHRGRRTSPPRRPASGEPDRHRRRPTRRTCWLSSTASRSRGQGADARHRRARDRRARHAASVRAARAARQPDRRLPAAPRRAGRASRSSSSAPG